MKDNYMKWLNKATAGILMLAGLAACSDNWDEHYDMAATTSTKTLWEQIEENENLKDFARLLERVHYFNSETQRYENYTYKDLLSGTQTLTVWAPEDNTFDVAALLQQCEETEMRDLDGDGIAETVYTGEYKVEHEFIRNHITRFRTNLSGTGNDSLTMFSSKMNVLDRDKRTIRDIKIAQSNIGASNGILHTIAAPLPFQKNLLEFFYTDTRLLSNEIDPETGSRKPGKMLEFFQRFDTTYIDKYQSTQGPIVNDEITYVDEVWVTNHQLLSYGSSYQGNFLSGLGAYLNNEDSLYTMIFLTDPAWEQGLEKTTKLFNYRPSYQNKFDTQDKNDITVNVDSLKEMQSKLALIQHLAFNARTQKNIKPEDVGVVNADSLVTTKYNVIKAPNCNELFDGKSPEETSNGYAYVVDNYRFDLSQTVKKDIDLEAESTFFYTTSGTTNAITYSMDDLYRNPDVKGSFGDKKISYVMAPGRTNPSITYTIPNVLSGKYAIKVVFPPSNVLLRDQGTDPKPYKLNFTLKYYRNANGSEASATARNVEIIPDPNNLKNDTVTLDLKVNNESFTEFPICYYGVNNAGVTLQITGAVNSNEIDKYAKNFFVDEIIFESKED
ncbi:MAG: hypothetical protein J6K41_05360 [Paraprevotella sp.]|jgi:lipoprotein|nr:hypothetical protein [Paraprevotella sp.]